MTTDIHGYVQRVILGDGIWHGEFGTCYYTWLEEGDRARSKEDSQLLERLVAKMSRAELVSALVGLGKQAFVQQKVRDLRLSLQIAQMRAWWPYKDAPRTAGEEARLWRFPVEVQS